MARYGVSGRLSKSICVEELTKQEVTLKNVHVVLQEIIEKYKEKFPDGNKIEKTIIKGIMCWMGHYLYASWDKEKCNGHRRDKQESLNMVNSFLSRYANK